MDKNEQDITYRNRAGSYEDDDNIRREGSDNSYSVINPSNSQSQDDQQDEIFYDELDRKCTLKKKGTVGSMIILHRARTRYNGKLIFDIAIALLGVVGILMFAAFIFINIRKGWSESNIYDVSAGNKISKNLFIYFFYKWSQS